MNNGFDQLWFRQKRSYGYSEPTYDYSMERPDRRYRTASLNIAIGRSQWNKAITLRLRATDIGKTGGSSIGKRAKTKPRAFPKSPAFQPGFFVDRSRY
jgi:hypothetical protein